jgi:hypothetical protein
VFDSCHSVSGLDIPYIYSTQGLLEEPDLAKEAGQGLLGVVASSGVKSPLSLLNQAPKAAAFTSREPTVASSWACITSIKKHPVETYKQILQSIRHELQQK